MAIGRSRRGSEPLEPLAKPEGEKNPFLDREPSDPLLLGGQRLLGAGARTWCLIVGAG